MSTAVETVSELKLAAGVHQVTVFALDPGVTLDRLEILSTGAAHSYGAVPETRVVGAPAARVAAAIGVGL
jgi:hypothetical protein